MIFFTAFAAACADKADKAWRETASGNNNHNPFSHRGTEAQRRPIQELGNTNHYHIFSFLVLFLLSPLRLCASARDACDVLLTDNQTPRCLVLFLPQVVLFLAIFAAWRETVSEKATTTHSHTESANCCDAAVRG